MSFDHLTSMLRERRERRLWNQKLEGAQPGLRERLDSKLGVTPGVGLALVIAATCVAGQWTLILLQTFCRPCIRTMFESLSL